MMIGDFNFRSVIIEIRSMRGTKVPPKCECDAMW